MGKYEEFSIQYMSMEMIAVFFTILVASLYFAARSMRDFDSAGEVRKMVRKRKKGTIVFHKNRVKHYSS